MKQNTFIFACLCSAAAIAVVNAVPVPAGNQELDVLQIPLTNGKELDVLTIGAKDQEQIIADRNKRTIGLLRELFPDITKQIDDQVNRIISKFLRTLGPTVLRTAIQGNSANRARTNFNADFDNDDDNKGSTSKQTDNTSSTSSGTRVSIELPTFKPEDDDNEVDSKNKSTSSSSTTTTESTKYTQIDLTAINKQLEETIRVARQVKEAEAAATQAQQQATAAQQQQQQVPPQLPIPQKPAKPLPEQTIQLSFNNEVSPLTTNDNLKAVNNDLQSTESKSPAIDELTLDSNEDTADLDDRNKRFLSFGGAGLAGGASGGAGSGGAGGSAAPGGSGNFLFDIVRLFSGSVQTQSGDASSNSVSSDGGDSDSDANRAADGYTEGIPGPVTRLVVLANRGLANLIQDLILRIAATSEKFVNFKAKLITALI